MFDTKKVKNEIVKWIRCYFEQNDSIAVIGISGGKDSAVVAALCCEALGKERVLGVLMPQGVQADLDIALDLVKFLDIRHKIINIGQATTTLLAEICHNMGTQNAQASINTPARMRMAVLYAVSAYVNGRVANTCNLSEDFVGYSTKFGDSAGDFSPLSSITVTEVKQLGRELNLPSKFVDKTPIDGLCGKTDEENLGFTYAVLDEYIRSGVCHDESIKWKIDKMHNAGIHKLSPMPAYILETVTEN